MQETIEKIMVSVPKKKVQSLCKKILKKCSFKSTHDLGNITDLATWLYIYGYTDAAVNVCDFLKDFVFTGNYSLWSFADYSLCLKARILREQKSTEDREQLISKIQEHRHPELYVNLVDWYRVTLNKNIQNDDLYYPKKINCGWRLRKMCFAIQYKETGDFPISDEEFEADIKEIITLLKQVK